MEDIIIIQGKKYKIIPIEKEETSIQIEEERIANLPTSWKEWIEKSKDYGFANKLEYTSSKDKDLIFKILNLKRLRDIYNGNWKPDWKDLKQIKFCIIGEGISSTREIRFYVDKYYTFMKLLAFKSEKLAQLFLKNFKEIIEETKDLY